LMVANRMVQLDHMTRGRVLFGVGPGALPGDAYMMGIPHETQRERMDEALGAILRLFTETEPITYRTDWFELNEAMIQLRPLKNLTCRWRWPRCSHRPGSRWPGSTVLRC
jgi:limonene 1,2-monooxygenase